jgi:hypothetical protein
VKQREDAEALALAKEELIGKYLEGKKEVTAAESNPAKPLAVQSQPPNDAAPVPNSSGPDIVVGAPTEPLVVQEQAPNVAVLTSNSSRSCIVVGAPTEPLAVQGQTPNNPAPISISPRTDRFACLSPKRAERVKLMLAKLAAPLPPPVPYTTAKPKKSKRRNGQVSADASKAETPAKEPDACTRGKYDYVPRGTLIFM